MPTPTFFCVWLTLPALSTLRFEAPPMLLSLVAISSASCPRIWSSSGTPGATAPAGLAPFESRLPSAPARPALNGRWIASSALKSKSPALIAPGTTHRTFSGNALPTVRESVHTTSGSPAIVGGGVWQRPNSMTPAGKFDDYLSNNGNSQQRTTNQSFTGTDALGTVNLNVNMGGQLWGVLFNTYRNDLVTIVNTTAPRACSPGDPC